MNLKHLFVFLGWVIICSSPNARGQDLTDGLVAYYPFNGNANDESGNGNDGTVNGATLTTDRDGNTDSALLITTGDGGVTSAANIPISGNADRTISFWCKFSSPTDPGFAAVRWGSTSRYGGMFRFSEVHRGPDGDQLHFWGHHADNTYPPSGAPYDQWRHLVFVYHSSIDDAVCYANANVVPLQSHSPHNNTTTLNTISTPLNIHGNTGGFIDDVRIYDRALSEAEVSELYELERPATTGSTFEIVQGTFTWEEARADAEAQGGRLAVLNTSEVLATATPIINSFPGSLWIGLSDKDQEGEWMWITGEPLTFANWEPGQPDNNTATEDYAHIFWSSGDSLRRWNDSEVNDNNVGTGNGNLNNDKGYLLEIPASANDGLVAYYPFNGNANDESGNGNDGTVNGATLTTDRHGNADSAYSFDGSSTITANNIELAQHYTVSVWFNSNDQVGVNNAILTLRKSNSNNSYVHIFHNDRINLRYNNRNEASEGGGTNIYSNRNLHDGTWHQAICIKKPNLVELYVDGSKVAEAEDLGAVHKTAELNVGYNISPDPQWDYDGRIDDIRIYNRALSEEEVSELYELEAPALAPTPPGLEIATYLESDPGEPLTVDATPISGYPTDFTYQWHLDGAAIPAAFGGTGSSIVLDGLLTFEGSWRVVVTNSEGSAEATFDYRVFVDTDGDGLSDGYESLISLTDPFDADTDQDGLNDSSEVQELGTDPLLADTDGDGFDDYYELRNRFDPINPSSTPESVATVFPTGDFQFIEFRFNTAKGLHYRVESSTDLTNWATEETGITGRGGPVYRYFSTENRPRAFFRARRE